MARSEHFEHCRHDTDFGFYSDLKVQASPPTWKWYSGRVVQPLWRTV